MYKWLKSAAFAGEENVIYFGGFDANFVDSTNRCGQVFFEHYFV